VLAAWIAGWFDTKTALRAFCPAMTTTIGQRIKRGARAFQNMQGAKRPDSSAQTRSL